MFGKPAKLRLEFAGGWRSQEVSAYFERERESERDRERERECVELDTIPAEAHWGISHVERAIRCTKWH